MTADVGAPYGLQANAALVDELKRTIEALPLEMNAVSSVAPRLAALDAPSFAVLLKDLARDNHAFRLTPKTSPKVHGLYARCLGPHRLYGDRVSGSCVVALPMK